jgi:hypothetical protein
LRLSSEEAKPNDISHILKVGGGIMASIDEDELIRKINLIVSIIVFISILSGDGGDGENPDIPIAQLLTEGP